MKPKNSYLHIIVDRSASHMKIQTFFTWKATKYSNTELFSFQLSMHFMEHTVFTTLYCLSPFYLNSFLSPVHRSVIIWFLHLLKCFERTVCSLFFKATVEQRSFSGNKSSQSHTTHVCIFSCFCFFHKLPISFDSTACETSQLNLSALRNWMQNTQFKISLSLFQREEI